MANLSKLEEIKDLREVWPHEALDFTPWLSQDNNIAILADAIGFDSSDPAVKFEVIEKPNDWTKEVRKNEFANETQQQRYDYWVAFQDYAFQKTAFAKEFKLYLHRGKILMLRQASLLPGVNCRRKRQAKLSLNVLRNLETNHSGKNSLTGLLMLWRK